MFIGKNDINGLVKKQNVYTGKKGPERPVCSKTEKILIICRETEILMGMKSERG